MKEILKVDSVSKKFCRDLKKSLKYGLNDIVSEVLCKPIKDKLREDEFWALNRVSFELKRGQCIGLVGGNGAGKSTLFKIISGLIKPSSGRVTVMGSLQALIELGAGFHPLLNCKENIEINSAVLGINQKEIDYSKIIDFAELKGFEKAPLGTYSSGMKARLGFAIAMNLKPDILIVDEVLSVGDSSFRAKSRSALRELIKKNSAVIITSHNKSFVSQMASDFILLNQGEKKYQGTSSIECYEIYEKLTRNAPREEVIEVKSEQIYITDEKVITNQNNINLFFKIKTQISFQENIYHIIMVSDSNREGVGTTILESLVQTEDNETELKGIQIDIDNLLNGSYHLIYRIVGPGLVVYAEKEWVFEKSGNHAKLTTAAANVMQMNLKENNRGSINVGARFIENHEYSVN